eukprot:GHVS01024983.1.p1 GENE.GHVS01024983.1~~GHVS01024983.1.p1  ORF type:complete len:240 (-),score=2.88 GHVS01024983.1:73-792(-)
MGKDSFNQVMVGRAIWEKSALVGALYGLSVIPVPAVYLDKMEAIQSDLGRCLTGAAPFTATDGIRGELGWMRVKDRVAVQKLTYLNYLCHCNSDRFCKAIFDELWSLEIDTKWKVEIVSLLDDYALSIEELMLAGVRQAKAVVKGRVQDASRILWRMGVSRKSSLKWLTQKTQPHFEEYLDGTYGSRLLFKLRTGSLALGQRVKWEDDRLCMVCREGVLESECHFILECEGTGDEKRDV